MFKNMNKKQKALVKGILLFFLICIILVIVIGFFKNRKLSYSEIENKLVNAAEKYYADHTDLLPKENGGTVTVDSLTLMENKYMKAFEKYNKNVVACSGSVAVTNNNGYNLYIPTLKCEGYETISLYNQILKSEEIVTEKSGLYEMDGEYVYRGEFPNNYVKFAGKTWRILRLTSGGEVRLIDVGTYQEKPWDNRYNVNAKYSAGITKYEISRIKDHLANIYNEDFKEDEKSYIVSKQLCIGKRNKKEVKNDGSIECATLTEESYPIGMIQVNEYIIASIDENCKLQTDSACINYNYLRKLEGSSWTITASSANDYEVYYSSGAISTSVASEYRLIRITINIDGNMVYKKGSGTEDDPYVIS